MAELIAEAKANLNRTPFADRRLFATRLGHLRFLERLAAGKI